MNLEWNTIQRNVFVALLIKTKKQYYKDLRLSNVNDNKKVWKTAKPLFGNKINRNSQIALADGNDLFTGGKALAEMFNKFLINAVPALGIKYGNLLSNYNDSN